MFSLQPADVGSAVGSAVGSGIEVRSEASRLRAAGDAACLARGVKRRSILKAACFVMAISVQYSDLEVNSTY